MTPPYTKRSQKMLWASTVISRQTPINYKLFSRLCLKAIIVDKIEAFEDKENPMRVGIISSHDCQYLRKAVGFHWP